MPYVTPAPVVSGTVGSSSTFGNVVIGDLNFLANPPSCRVYHNAAQSIPNGAWTALAFNSERYDTDTMHDTVTNNSRITATTAGLYVVTGSFSFAANGTGVRIGAIAVNGTQIATLGPFPGDGTNGNNFTLATTYKVTAGQYFELQGYQASGAGLNVSVAGNYSPEFAATWVGLG